MEGTAEIAADSQILDGPPQARLLHELCSLSRSNPHSVALLLLWPIVLLMGYLKRKDLDFTQHRLLFPLPSLSEAADLLLANFSLYTGFFVCFDHGGLMRSGSLDRPSLRYRPAAFFSGCNEHLSRDHPRVSERAELQTV